MSYHKNHFKLLIVGAGPAGIMAALTAHAHGLEGRNILLLEKNKRPGAKLLLTGNGRCNLTQDLSCEEFSRYFYEQEKSVKSCFRRFGPQDLIDFFVSSGLELKWESRKVYPKSEQANDVLMLLEEKLKEAKINLCTQEALVNLKYFSGQDYPYELETSKGNTLFADHVILACGGKSYPKTGSTGFTSEFAKENNIELEYEGPGLSPIYIAYGNTRPEDLAGISLSDISGEIVSLQKSQAGLDDLNSSLQAKSLSPTRQADLLFTHQGLSGPLALNLSRYLVKFPLDKLAVRLNLLPGQLNWKGQNLSPAELFSQWQKEYANKLVSNLLNSLLPSRLVKFLLENRLLSKQSLHLAQMKFKSINYSDWHILHEDLQSTLWPVKKLANFNEAMVTAGGVSLRAIKTHDFSVKSFPGLYIVGESLDVDGETGGFNLQFAFTSGYIAGKAVADIYS